MLKATVLQNFATIGISEVNDELQKNYWTAAGISEYLIDKNRLIGLQRLNTRQLDIVLQSGKTFSLFNLPAFKAYECPLATETIQQCLAHYLTPDGSILFGMQPSGDIIVLTGGLDEVKRIRKPAFIKIHEKSQQKWFEGVPVVKDVVSLFSTKSKVNNQVSPEASQSGPVTPASQVFSVWWPSTGLGTSTTCINMPDNLKTQFPYINALPDGMAVFCAFSPANCYIFLSSYETALREKSIANFRGNQIPGRFYRILMNNTLIANWIEDKGVTPWFDARLCYNKDEDGQKVVGGAILYAVFEGVTLEILYGIINWTGDRFNLTWETLQYEVDWALREPGVPYNLRARFVARLSADCKKIAIVITTHQGLYMHIQRIPLQTDEDFPIHLRRQAVAMCNHSDYDGAHFYRKDCWISDMEWLVEDAYIACMSLCGSLTFFHTASGEPMILKVRRPGAVSDESKSARFFHPVFHPQQLQDQIPERAALLENLMGECVAGGETLYPTIKWIDKDRILACSSGTTVELFSIQRVLNLPVEDTETVLSMSDWEARMDEKFTVSSFRLSQPPPVQQGSEEPLIRSWSQRISQQDDPPVHQNNNEASPTSTWSECELDDCQNIL